MQNIFKIAEYNQYSHDVIMSAPNVYMQTNNMTLNIDETSQLSIELYGEALSSQCRLKFSRNTIQYSIDNRQTWTDLPPNTYTPYITKGNRIFLRSTGPDSLTIIQDWGGGMGTFTLSGNFKFGGNVMSLLFGSKDLSYKRDIKKYPYCFCKLFYDCTTLIDISNLLLPAYILGDYCYYYMFYNCKNLTGILPKLPAHKLANYCYCNMFKYCAKITDENLPKLPAKTLSDGCYEGMFEYCTGITTTPELPATKLAKYCYAGMFLRCTNLKTTTKLNALTLCDGCYQQMFQNCTSLVTAPELPATKIAQKCYDNMFNGCTSLTNIPTILPAKTLEYRCYAYMFDGCTSITIAPELPATTLADSCYMYMFIDCTSLTSVPYMCTAYLYDSMAEYMFMNCNNLSYIKCLLIPVHDSAAYMFDGVASTGTFIRNYFANWDDSYYGLPDNWEHIITCNPIECLSLKISANNVMAHETSTIISYTAIVKCVDENSLPMSNIKLLGDVISDKFEENTSTTDYVIREISYEFMGKTATTSIRQNYVMLGTYSLTPHNSRWWQSESVHSPNLEYFDNVYESEDIRNTVGDVCKMTIEIDGYDEFTLYVGFVGYDEMLYVSELDKELTYESDGTYVDVNGEIYDGLRNWDYITSTNDIKYVPITYKNIGGGKHTITLLYYSDYDEYMFDTEIVHKAYLFVPKHGKTNRDYEISFTVNGYEKTYTAYYCMSWEEYMYSDYNEDFEYSENEWGEVCIIHKPTQQELDVSDYDYIYDGTIIYYNEYSGGEDLTS